MNLSRLLLVASLLVPMGLASAQTLTVPTPDPAVPRTPLEAKTALTVLNARHGSRFSLSLVPSEKGTHTGALGMDNDQFRELWAGLSVQGQKQGFRTCALPEGTQFLKNQSIGLGMTHTQLVGQMGNLELTLTLVSPFTPAYQLEDTAQLLTQIVPAYHIVAQVRNKGKAAASGDFQLGFKAIPFDRDKEVGYSLWRRNQPTQILHFRDQAAPNTLLALATQAKDSRHFDMEAFNGLQIPFSVGPGATWTQTLVYATHHGEKVMTDLKLNQELRFYYTRFFKNVEQVAAYALSHQAAHLAASARFEQFLSRSQASPEEKWVSALAFHTDQANALLLQDEKGNPRFYLTEGRFRHMNTIDVAMETELMALFAPWRLKLQIEQWTDYLATKEVPVGSYRSFTYGVRETTEGISASELGPFLYHDVGNFPYVLPAEGYDFGPIMPVEENSNFALLLYWYWKLSGDEPFVRRHLGLLQVLMESLKNRDSNGNGLADYAVGWSTYDVSEALKRSPENVYLGVKQACAYLVAAEMLGSLTHKASLPKGTPFKATGEDGHTLNGNEKGDFERKIMDNTLLRARQAKEWIAEAEKIIATLKLTQMTKGGLPVSLEQSFEGWEQQSIVLGEALFLPGLAGCQAPQLKDLAAILAPDYKSAYKASITPYGIKLSSGEDVTWFSKVMVSDLVARYWYNEKASSCRYTYAWNQNNPMAYQDGAFSATKPWPGNWYPRGMSALGYILQSSGFAGGSPQQVKTWLKGLE